EPAQRGRPARPSPGSVDRRPEHDLEQGVAVEVRREGVAQALERLLEAHSLLAELLEPALELAGHVVELLAQRRELVPSDDRNPGGEVPRPKPPGRLEKA